MSNAPNCPISRSQPKIKSQANGIDVAHIPPATDLRSAISALNSLNNALRHLTRTPPQVNNIYPATTTGIPSPLPQYGQYRWTEESRNYREQRVVNPDNPAMFVTISTLVNVNWVESTTGHSIEYKSDRL